MAHLGVMHGIGRDDSGVGRRYTWRAPRWLRVALVVGVVGLWGAGIWWGVTQVGNGSAEVASESAFADEAAVLRARVEHLTQQSNTLTAERDALVKRVADLEAQRAVVAIPQAAVVASDALAVESMNVSTPAPDSSGEYSIPRFAYRASAGPTAAASTGTPTAPAASATPGLTGTPVRFFTNGADKYNCTSFTSQAEAQEALAANAPGDPNRMDMNANGVACEDIAYAPTAPRNLTPIANR